jgi:hypothetical protein
MTNQVETLKSHGISQGDDIRGQFVIGVGFNAVRTRPGTVAPLVGRKAAIAFIGELCHQIRPHTRSLGETVQQHERLPGKIVLTRSRAAKDHFVGLDFPNQ